MVPESLFQLDERLEHAEIAGRAIGGVAAENEVRVWLEREPAVRPDLKDGALGEVTLEALPASLEVGDVLDDGALRVRRRSQDPEAR